jgi:LacI family transcriptional regulator
MTAERTQATIRDVARRASVSTATVSRVMAGIGKSRQETVAAVLAAVGELDYRPSGVARSLKLRHTRTLGLIVTDIQNPFFPELVRAADDAARDLGYTILLGSAADDDDRAMGYLDLMVDRRVDGIIIASSMVTARHWVWLLNAPVPVVVVNAEPAGPRVPVIVSDNEAGGRLAAEHLLALGHRCIGYISGPDTYAAAMPRLAGFRQACATAGLTNAASPIVRGDGGVESGERAAAELVARTPGLTGVACYNDLTAIGALRALRALGLRVPGDVSVVGLDAIAAAAWVEPPLTTVIQQKAAMGRLAVQRLRQAMLQPDGGEDENVVRLPVSLRIGASSGPPPGRRQRPRLAEGRTGGTMQAHRAAGLKRSEAMTAMEGDADARG